MAISYVQHSQATATTGALVAADYFDFGTATTVAVQVVKLGYATSGGTFTEVASGAGLPIATGPIYNVQQSSSASSPVTLLTLPTAATLPVAVATGFLFSVQQTTTSTSSVNVTSWTATAFVNVLQGTTVTIPVSMSSAATIPVTFSTSLYPQVDVGTPTATGLLADNIASATAIIFGSFPFGFATTATGLLSWHRLRAATTGVLLTNVQNTATVTLTGLPTTATLPVTVATSPVFNVQQMSTATSPVNVTSWTATAFVNVLQGTTVTIPVSVSSAATLPVVLSTLPTTATMPVFITGGSSAGQQYAESVSATASATGFIGNIMLGEDSNDILRIIRTDATGNIFTSALSSASQPTNVTSWTATAFVNVLQGTTVTIPVSVSSAATLPITFSTALYPIVDVGTPTATGLLGDNIASATAILFGSLSYGFATTATGLLSWHRLRAATTGVLLTNVQNTATVTLSGLPTTATLPVTVATSPVFNVQQMSTATSPVSVTSLTATGVLFINNAGTATLIVSVNNTATVAISGRVPVIGQWTHDATATINNPVMVGGVAETGFVAGVADGDIVSAAFDIHGRIITMPFAPRGNVFKVYTNVSGTATGTLATGSGTAGRFRDLVGLVISNAATTTAVINVKSSSTATDFNIAIAGDGGGHQMHPGRPWLQEIAATDWVIALATAIAGKLHISAQFIETT